MSLSPYIISPVDQHPHHCVLISIHYITSQLASTSLCPYLHTLYHQLISIHITVSLSPYLISPVDQHPHHCVLITIHQITSQSAFTSLCPYLHTLYHQLISIHITVSLSPYIISPVDQHSHHCVLIIIHFTTSQSAYTPRQRFMPISPYISPPTNHYTYYYNLYKLGSLRRVLLSSL